MFKKVVAYGLAVIPIAAILASNWSEAAISTSTLTVKVTVQRLPETDVIDLTSGSLPPLPNAKIEIPELGITTTTDENGSVVVTLRPGIYTFNVSVEGVPHTTTDVRRISEFGANEFVVHFNTLRDVYMDNATPIRRYDQLVNPPGPSMPGLTPISDSDASVQYIPIEPSLPRTIQVYSRSQDRLYQYAIEDYVKKVLAKEIGLGLYRPYLTDAQERIMFEAKAIVARTYGTYHTYFQACAAANRFNAKIDDTTSCQVVDHGFTGSSTDNINKAVSNTYHKIAIYVTDFQNGEFNYIDSVFFASDNGTTKSAQSVWGYYYPYLQSEIDAYDEDVSNWICSNKPQIGFCPFPRVGGYAGHGVGFSQDGNAGYAKRGYSSTWIVTHYYRGTSVYQAHE